MATQEVMATWEAMTTKAVMATEEVMATQEGMATEEATATKMVMATKTTMETSIVRRDRLITDSITVTLVGNLDTLPGIVITDPQATLPTPSSVNCVETLTGQPTVPNTRTAQREEPST